MVLGFFLLSKYSALSFFSSKHNRAKECRLSLSAQMESAPIDVLGLFPRSRYSAPFLFSSKYNRIKKCLLSLSAFLKDYSLSSWLFLSLSVQKAWSTSLMLWGLSLKSLNMWMLNILTHMSFFSAVSKGNCEEPCLPLPSRSARKSSKYCLGCLCSPFLLKTLRKRCMFWDLFWQNSLNIEMSTSFLISQFLANFKA